MLIVNTISNSRLPVVPLNVFSRGYSGDLAEHVTLKLLAKALGEHRVKPCLTEIFILFFGDEKYISVLHARSQQAIGNRDAAY